MISVIIPAYNEEQHLPACLRSLNQAARPSGGVEVIVVDNGSTDRTGEVARSGGACCVVEATRGAGAARNRGVREARGDILAFLDADCTVSVDWLQRIEQALSDRGVDAVMGTFDTVEGNIWAELRYQRRLKWMERITHHNNLLSIVMGNFAIRRHVLEAVGGFDESFYRAHDTELGLRLYRQGYVATFAPDMVVCHRGPENLQETLATSRKHGFYTHKLIREHGPEFSQLLFPEVRRGYHRYLLTENHPGAGIALPLLSPGLAAVQGILHGLLLVLHIFRVNCCLGQVFELALDVAFFRGKVRARLLERREARMAGTSSTIT